MAEPSSAHDRAGRPDAAGSGEPPEPQADATAAGQAGGARPSSRTGCGGRSPTWTTCASASTARSRGSGQAERPRVAARGCRSSTTSSCALEHPPTTARRDRRGRRARCATRRSTSWPGSASRASTTSASRSTRPGTRRSARSRPMPPPGTVVAVCGPATATPDALLRPAAVVVATEAGLMAAPRTSTRCSGVDRDASRRRDPARLPQAGPHLPPGRQQGPGRRGAVQGDLRGVRRAVRSRDRARRYDRSAHDFRQVPEGVDPQTWAGARGAAVRAPGARPGRGGHRRVRRTDVGSRARASTSRTSSAACSAAGGGGGRGARSPAPTRRPSSTLTVEEAYRGGRTAITLAGPGRPAQLRRDDPARRHRRPAHPAGRAGRPGQRRRPGGRPLPGRADRPAPPVPGGGPGHLTSTCRSRPGRRRWAPRSPVDTPGGEAKVRVPAGYLERPAAAAARPGHAQPARRARRPLRRGPDHGAAAAQRRRARAVRGAGRACRRSTRGGGETDDRTAYPLARRVPAALDLESFARAPALHPDAGPAVRRARPARRRAGRRRAALVRARAAAGGRPDAAAARRAVAELRRARPRARPARPHRRAWKPALRRQRTHDRPTGGTTMDMNRLTQKSQEALHDAQTDGAAARPHRGRRRAPAARPARPARRPGPAAARRRPAPTPDALRADARSRAARAGRGSPARAPHPARCSSPSGSARLLDTAEREARRLKDEYVSVEHLLLALLGEGRRTAAGRRAGGARRHPGRRSCRR